MAYCLDIELLVRLVHIKRDGLRLREAAIASGVSASTLSRVENGKTPDIPSLLALCDWLKIPASMLIVRDGELSPNYCDAVYHRLLAEEKLDSDIRNALVALIRAAYSGRLG